MSTKGEKQRWLQEVQGIMRRLHEVGHERIPAEFKAKIDLGIVVWLRDQHKNVSGGVVGERLGVLVEPTDKPIVLGFSDAGNQNNLWKSDHTRYHTRSWKEFVNDLIPFDLDWLYSSWRRGLDFSYLMIDDEKITVKTMQQCANQEIRKYLLKRFSQQKLRKNEAKMIDEEYEFQNEDGRWIPIWQDKYFHHGSGMWKDAPRTAKRRKSGQYLFEVSFEGNAHRFVKVNDSSVIKDKRVAEALGSDRREYMLEVPAVDDVASQSNWRRQVDFPVSTVQAAIAYTFGFNHPQDYHPVKQT